MLLFVSVSPEHVIAESFLSIILYPISKRSFGMSLPNLEKALFYESCLLNDFSIFFNPSIPSGSNKDKIFPNSNIDTFILADELFAKLYKALKLVYKLTITHVEN